MTLLVSRHVTAKLLPDTDYLSRQTIAGGMALCRQREPTRSVHLGRWSRGRRRVMGVLGWGGCVWAGDGGCGCCSWVVCDRALWGDWGEAAAMQGTWDDGGGGGVCSGRSHSKVSIGLPGRG